MRPQPFEHPAPPVSPEVPQTPEQEFRALQAELQSLAQLFASRHDIPEDIRQEVIGAAYEQPPTAGLTVSENAAIRDLLLHAREALDAVDGRTVH